MPEREGQIWVDADACPLTVREILLRAAERTGVRITFVANQAIRLPAGLPVNAVQVPPGFDVADNYIVQHVIAADLVITQDIPLASEVVKLGAAAVGPRGQRHTRESIGQRLAIRDLMSDLRDAGMVRGGPPPLSPADKQNFANQLDQWLTRWRSVRPAG